MYRFVRSAAWPLAKPIGTGAPGNERRMQRDPAWPSAHEYAEAVVRRDAIGNAASRDAAIERKPGGTPKVYAGAFTATFHLIAASGDTALRCYTRERDDVERRYTAIAELLRYARTEALVPARYLDEGISVGGAWWPAVSMEWVGGRALNAEVEARLGDGDALLALAETFREMVRSLEALGIAHGDLQHGNILVSEGGLRLIDYDAMYLPAIADLPQREWGHRNYQHPRRREAAFDGRLDRFSSLVIYIALIALAADRSLWRRFNDGDNLLFRAHDFTSHGDSELFRSLLAYNATSGLAGELLAACRAPVDDVPTLEQAISAASGTMPAARPDSPPRRATSPAAATPPPPPPPLPAEDATVRVAGVQRVGRSTALTAVAVVLIGLLIGVALAAWTRGTPRTSTSRSGRETIATATRSTHAATHAPVATPAATATPLATATPVAKRTVRVNAAPVQGTWQIDEANVQDGRMVWTGTAARSSGGAIVLDVHKASVAGSAATSCERATNLHVPVLAGAAGQTTSFQERNCSGATSTGEVRVDGVAPDGRSFRGSFWQSGVKLGDFIASRQ